MKQFKLVVDSQQDKERSRSLRQHTMGRSSYIVPATTNVPYPTGGRKEQ